MRNKSMTVGLAFFVVWMCLAGSATAEDAAMVVDLKGDQLSYVGGDLAGQGIVLMDFLAAGDRVEIKAGTTVVLNYFASGVREEISGPAVVTIGTEGSRKEGEGAIKSEKVAYLPPQSQTTKGDSGHVGATVMKSSDSSHVGSILLRSTGREMSDEVAIAPSSLSSTAVRNAPLIFRWQPVNGAEKYQIAVKVGQEEILKTSTDKTAYTFEKSGIPRGVEISWSVEALAGDKVIGRGAAKFYLVALPKLQEIADSEQAMAKEFPGESIEGLIARVMMYKQYELNEEARELLLKLREKYPRNVTIVRHIKDLRSNYQPKL